MYRIMFNDKSIGESELEVGDPPMGCVSGIIKAITNTEEFSFFILQCGGAENDGEYRLELTDKFSVITKNDNNIPYSGGCILWYPELDEAVVDLVGIPYPEYEKLFPGHVVKYEKQF
ncbi:MAG: hypothetical protein KUG73_13200 [Pseudomonadales bacterium]|nr:hypothetical protein [Pseudomonadales bacterium]